jgi:hypothetical protein
LGAVRRATLLLVLPLVVLAGCSDLRDFAGEWRGSRVGTSLVTKVGIADDVSAELVIGDIDTHGLHGQLQVSGSGGAQVTNAPLVSLPGAEADALATMSFAGSPMRVYVAFVPIDDGVGDALAMVGLYDARRIDLRILRGGTSPIYAIFALSQQD